MATVSNVKGDATLLGLLVAALSAKVGGKSAADKKNVAPGEFRIEGSIVFKAEGVKDENYTQAKAKGLKWKEIFSAVLAVCGVTRDAARRIMAAMVEWNKACDRADEKKGRKFACPKKEGAEQQAWIKEFVQAAHYTNTKGEAIELHYLEVATIGLAQREYMAALEEDEGHFTSQLMEEGIVEGTIRFDEITVAAMVIEQSKAATEAA